LNYTHLSNQHTYICSDTNNIVNLLLSPLSFRILHTYCTLVILLIPQIIWSLDDSTILDVLFDDTSICPAAAAAEAVVTVEEATAEAVESTLEELVEIVGVEKIEAVLVELDTNSTEESLFDEEA